MTFVIRKATLDDVDHIRAFTADTFVWGDYVGEALESWLTDPHGAVWVAADRQGRAVGVARVVMMSVREAWLHAARVDPGYRRKGIASLLNDTCCGWATDRGAVVARLLIEDWNEAAQAQVASLGYRPVARWTSALIETGTEVIPSHNGGRRVPSEERLSPGRIAEADIAWMSWVNGETARSGKELVPFGWAFRRIRPSDLEEAAGRRELWQSPSGWLIARLDTEGELAIPWISTTDVDVARLVRAIFDLAEGMRAEQIRILTPRVGWLLDELTRVGYVLEPNTIYARELSSVGE